MSLPPHSPTASPARTKILSIDALKQAREQARAAGSTVVQCHGCFDIVHPGHIRHLRQAKSHGDILLVSITGDEAWTKRHGAPLIPEELRADNLAELDCVDWVTIDRRPTAVELLRDVHPDVYVKGKEYERNNDPRFAEERSVVEQAGGRVVFSSGDVVFSSTALIQSLERTSDPYHAQLGQLLAKPQLSGLSLTSVLSNARGKKILVVGETIFDTYVLCDQPEVASESPVLTLRPLERRQYDGGAAIIARHLAAMGAQPTLVTALPRRTESEQFRQRLEAEGVQVEWIAIDAPIAEKQRYLVGAQKVVKINNYHPLVIDAERQDALIRTASWACDGFDGAILADFGNGLLSPRVVDRLGATLRPKVGVLAGDVSGRKAALKNFRDFDLLAPCEAEARHAVQCFDEGLPLVAWRLMEETGAKHVFLTLGPDGLVSFERSPTVLSEVSRTDGDLSRVRGEHVPALTGFAIDPLGCGDTLLAAATLALCAGSTPLVAAFLGSLGAAVQAQRLGNTPISSTDLRHAIARIHAAQLIFTPDDETASMRRMHLGATTSKHVG
jgi:rfaE bifunctional protein nucleotidyltransferase chain/domain